MSARPIDDDFRREVGAALLGWIAATRGGRWSGPAGALDYVAVVEDGPQALVRDFVAWTAQGEKVPGATERIEAFADELLHAAIRGAA